MKNWIRQESTKGLVKMIAQTHDPLITKELRRRETKRKVKNKKDESHDVKNVI